MFLGYVANINGITKRHIIIYLNMIGIMISA